MPSAKARWPAEGITNPPADKPNGTHVAPANAFQTGCPRRDGLSPEGTAAGPSGGPRRRVAGGGIWGHFAPRWLLSLPKRWLRRPPYKISEVQTYFMPPGQPPQGSGCPAPRGCGRRRTSSLPGLSGLGHPLVLPLRHPLRKIDKHMAFVPLPAGTPAAGPRRQGRQPPDAREAAALQGARNLRPAAQAELPQSLRQAGLLSVPTASPHTRGGGGGCAWPRCRHPVSPPDPPAGCGGAAARVTSAPAGRAVACRRDARGHTTRDGGRPFPAGNAERLLARPRLSVAAPAEQGGALCGGR